MKPRDWKVVCRYGHVGIGKEVSLARFLQTRNGETCIDVFLLAQRMPAVKHRGVHSVQRITEFEYFQGLNAERKHPYLVRLLGKKPTPTLPPAS